jgi:hypothetical protein
MLRCVAHDFEHLSYEFLWYARMEKIAHRINEHETWASPCERRSQSFLVNCHAEAGATGAWISIGLVFGNTHCLEASR